jgi:Ca-activated chloride channel family protein
MYLRTYTFGLLLLFEMAGWGDTQVRSQATFKSDASLVLVPVVVTDKRGATVNGLPRTGFQVSEDRVAQGIFSFSEEDVSASIGLVLDISGSMRASLADAKMALNSLVNGANPGDEAFLYTVSDQPTRANGLTSELQSLASKVVFTKAGGSTALVDTIFAALHEFRSTHLSRRGLVIISDGIDNHSRHTARELMIEALESNVQIYPICLYSPPSGAKAMALHEARQGVTFLNDLADMTGGISFVTGDSRGVNKSAEAIGRVLHSEYLIGYIPRRETPDVAPHDGRWHAIQVKLNVPGLKVHARCGYY